MGRAGLNNPSAAAIKKLTGYEDVCNRFHQEAGIVTAEYKNRQNKEEFARRIKAGDLSAYAWMGRRTFTANGHLPYEDRANLACPYYAEGARRGVDTAAIFFAHECFGAGEDERREGFEMLKSCAPKSANCAAELAPYYETTRRTSVLWPVAADDREALRLYEQALGRQDKGAALAAKVEAVKARLEGRGAAPDAPEPVPTPTSVTPEAPVPLGVAPASRQHEARAEPARAPRERIDPRQRRCESLLRAVERNQAAAAANPGRHASRLATAQTRYQQACGG